jgi:predicted nucleic acid-binding protein
MVLDASAVVEWLLRLPLASAVSERLLAADALHAPYLLAVEVA